MRATITAMMPLRSELVPFIASLVTVVSMYDLTGSLRLALGDPQWRQFFIEGYVFIAAIYFFSSLLMSRYSLWLEKRITAGKSH